jgi:hypothetical protein
MNAAPKAREPIMRLPARRRASPEPPTSNLSSPHAQHPRRCHAVPTCPRR